MKVSKAKKERTLNLMASVFDCDYMIKRLEATEGKQSDIENWIQYRKDLIALLNKLQSK